MSRTYGRREYGKHITKMYRHTEIVRRTFECHMATHKCRNSIQESNQFQQYNNILNI